MHTVDYISFSDFSDKIKQDIYTRKVWENLSTTSQDDVFEMVHEIINFEFDYIPEALSIDSAWPRDFSEYLNTKSIPEKKRDFLNKYHRIIPEELRVTTILMGKDILLTKDINLFIEARNKAGADRIKDGQVEFEMSDKISIRTFKERTKKFLDLFNPIYFGLQITSG